MGGSPRGTSPRRWLALAGRISSAAVRRDRLWVGLERLGVKVARGFTAASFTAPLPGPRRFLGPWTKCSLRPLSSGRDGAPCSRRDCRPGRTVLSAPQPRRVARAGTGSRKRRQGSAAMSATHPTRLETRTKESNARASQRVKQTPWRNESEGRRAPAEVGSRPRGAGRTTGPSRPHRRGGGA